MLSEDKIRSAAGRVLGSVPSSWHLARIAERLSNLAPLSRQSVLKIPQDRKMPPATYMAWLLKEFGLGKMVYTNSLLEEATIAEFEGHYTDFAEEAQLVARLDVSNFVAERSITPISELLKKSVLSISDLYRYIAAQENSMEFELTDDLILRAIKELSSNPWRFFSYGEDAQELMPVLWEDL